MPRKTLLAVTSVAIFFTSIVAAAAQKISDAQLTALRLTIAEAILATNSQVSNRIGSPVQMNWFAELSDRSWSMTMNVSSAKGPFQIGMGGFLWGDEKEDWAVTYMGGGKMPDEPIQISGKLDWPLDQATSDRVRTNMMQVTKFGARSTIDWIRGTEFIIAASVVGGSTLLATGATGPAGIIAVGAAAVAGNTAVSVSATVRSIFDSEKTTAPPPAPPAPALPKKDEPLTPKDGMLFAGVTRDGSVFGSGPDARYTLVGNTKGNSMSGQVSQK